MENCRKLRAQSQKVDSRIRYYLAAHHRGDAANHLHVGGHVIELVNHIPLSLIKMSLIKTTAILLSAKEDCGKFAQ